MPAPNPQLTLSNLWQQLFPSLFGVIALVLLISLLEFRVTWILHDDESHSIKNAHENILNGAAYWNIWQSRVLGSWVMGGMQYLLGSTFHTAVLYSFLLFMLLKNATFYYVARQLGATIKMALATTTIFAGLFIILQDDQWLFAWDVLEIVVFTLLVHGAIQQRPWWYFVVLFTVGIFNRESALFISIWLMISAFNCHSWADLIALRWRPIAWFRFLLGLGLTIAGIWLVSYLRETLQLTTPQLSEAAAEDIVLYGEAAHIMVLWNLQDTFVSNWLHPTQYMNFLVSALVIATPVVLVYYRNLIASPRQPWWSLSCIYIGMYLAVWLFAYLNETRVFLYFLPFWCYFGLYVYLLYRNSSNAFSKETTENTTKNTIEDI